MADPKKRPGVKATVVRYATRKLDAPASQQVTDEDRAVEGFVRSGALIKPPYPLRALASLPRESSILGPCITAMEVNVDGFGEAYDYIGPAKEDTSEAAVAELNMLKMWFLSCHPFKSLVDLRRIMRRDYESCGNGYFEAMRTLTERVPTQLENLPAPSLWIARRDTFPTALELPVVGADGAVTTRAWSYRFRRYAQVVDRRIIWFKEFGDPRDLDAKDGTYAEPGTLPVKRRANEVIPFAIYDADTVYGVPRWMGNLLSVKGSRQAETVNYLFFERNAIPAMIITVSGGTLAQPTIDEINHFMREESAGVEGMNRVLIVEALPGEDDGDEGTVRIDVKPLQNERQQDAMFLEYDRENRKKVRNGFRMSELYVGDSEALNYATANVSKAHAEEQVFVPERRAFDTVMNRRLLRALGVRFWAFRSIGPEISDMATLADAADVFTRNGGLTCEANVAIVNEVLDAHIDPPKAPWAKLPFRIVELLVQQGRLKGLEEFEKSPEEMSVAGETGLAPATGVTADDLRGAAREMAGFVRQMRGHLDEMRALARAGA
jgi:PBSX family phage portal protein